MKKRVLITLFLPILLTAIYVLVDSSFGQEEIVSDYSNKKIKHDAIDIIHNKENIEPPDADESVADESPAPSREWYSIELASYFLAEFCRSIQSHSDIDEYIQEQLGSGADYNKIEDDIFRCEEQDIKDWGQLSIEYEKELSLGNQYAELMLAKITPSGFSHGRYWLMQASTWSEEAMNDIELNFDNIAFDEMQKLFYAKILNKDDVINEVSKDIDPNNYYEIIELANSWGGASSEQRKAILNHELIK